MDDQELENIPIPTRVRKIWLSNKEGEWEVASQAPASEKGPHRYGTFKDAFKNRVMFVFGTQGSKEENEWAYSKARFDAEYLWYQGNGSIDVVADKDFNPQAEANRNVIIYGNAQTNSAWDNLLGDSPIQVRSGEIKVGDKTIRGNEQGCLLIRPRPGSDIASVGAICGSGIVGLKLMNRRPYLRPANSYPDFTVFTPELYNDRDKQAIVTGFFGLDWTLDTGEVVWADE